MFPSISAAFRTFVTAGLLSLSAASAVLAEIRHEADNRTVIQSSFDDWRNGTGGPFSLLSDDARWTIEGNSLAAKPIPTATLSSAKSSSRSMRG